MSKSKVYVTKRIIDSELGTWDQNVYSWRLDKRKGNNHIIKIWLTGRDKHEVKHELYLLHKKAGEILQSLGYQIELMMTYTGHWQLLISNDRNSLNAA